MSVMTLYILEQELITMLEDIDTDRCVEEQLSHSVDRLVPIYYHDIIMMSRWDPFIYLDNPPFEVDSPIEAMRYNIYEALYEC